MRDEIAAVGLGKRLDAKPDLVCGTDAAGLAEEVDPRWRTPRLRSNLPRSRFRGEPKTRAFAPSAAASSATRPIWSRVASRTGSGPKTRARVCRRGSPAWTARRNAARANVRRQSAAEPGTAPAHSGQSLVGTLDRPDAAFLKQGQHLILLGDVPGDVGDRQLHPIVPLRYA